MTLMSRPPERPDVLLNHLQGEKLGQASVRRSSDKKHFGCDRRHSQPALWTSQPLSGLRDVEQRKPRRPEGAVEAGRAC